MQLYVMARDHKINSLFEPDIQIRIMGWYRVAFDNDSVKCLSYSVLLLYIIRGPLYGC